MNYYLTQAGVKFINEKMKRRKSDTSTSHLSTDPENFGSTTKGEPRSNPRNISVGDSEHFEPAEKMKTKKSRAKVDKIKTAIKSGVKMPPVVRDTSRRVKTKKAKKLVTGKGRRKYTIIDGGHRLKAYKELGIENIPSVTPGKVTR
jgi:hypothetical protein